MVMFLLLSDLQNRSRASSQVPGGNCMQLRGGRGGNSPRCFCCHCRKGPHGLEVRQQISGGLFRSYYVGLLVGSCILKFQNMRMRGESLKASVRMSAESVAVSILSLVNATTLADASPSMRASAGKLDRSVILTPAPSEQVLPWRPESQP